MNLMSPIVILRDFNCQFITSYIDKAKALINFSTAYVL